MKKEEDKPSVASVLEQELIAIGIPKESIIKEEESQNTWQQLQWLAKLLRKQNPK